MVELKLFHKILIFIAVVISLIRLTNICAPKSVKPKVDYRNLNSYYIPPTSSCSRPVERVATPRQVAPAYIPAAPSTVTPSPEIEHESGVFYVRGLD